MGLKSDFITELERREKKSGKQKIEVDVDIGSCVKV